MKNSKRDRFLFCRMLSCFDCEPCKEDCIKKLIFNKGINNISIGEAINIMAKAIFEDMLKGHNLTWEDADISAKKPFINQAEAALNALLKRG